MKISSSAVENPLKWIPNSLIIGYQVVVSKNFFLILCQHLLHVFWGLIVIYFTMVATIVCTIFTLGDVSLEARASLYSYNVCRHPVQIFFTRTCILPEIERPSSVHIPKEFFHSMFAVFIKLFQIGNNASAVALNYIG